MVNDSLVEIQSLGEELHLLYRMAGKQHLTQEQLDRLHTIEARLPMLWDAHRRELASSRRPIPYKETFRRIA